jgi:hypothetical protein
MPGKAAEMFGADQTAINLPLGEDGVGRSRDVQQRRMKNSDQKTERRAARTLGVV